MSDLTFLASVIANAMYALLPDRDAAPDNHSVAASRPCTCVWT